MGYIDLLLLALGLSMDAFAVAVANASAGAAPRKRDCLMMGVYFGGFQGVMPVIGFALGSLFADYMAAVSHWIALALLGFIGVRMIAESFKQKAGTGVAGRAKLTHGTLALQALATSIDALAAGVTAALMGIPLWLSALVIAAVTFIMVSSGSIMARRLGVLLQRRASLAGGIMLVLIGVKIFVQAMQSQ